MDYTPPRISRIKIHGSEKVIANAVLATDSMQLPGFISLKITLNGKAATRFVSIAAIEEMTIENDELCKTMPCSFVPEVRLKAKIDGSL